MIFVLSADTLGTTRLDVVTLVVAIVGVTFGAPSLGWQAATFVLSGSRAGVTPRSGAVRRLPEEASHMSFPKKPTAAGIGSLPISLAMFVPSPRGTLARQRVGHRGAGTPSA
jgi:hypothetical protein